MSQSALVLRFEKEGIASTWVGSHTVHAVTRLRSEKPWLYYSQQCESIQDLLMVLLVPVVLVHQLNQCYLCLQAVHVHQDGQVHQVVLSLRLYLLDRGVQMLQSNPA